MIKFAKLAYASLAIALTASLTACGSTPDADGSKPAEVKMEPVDLSGTWIAPGEDDTTWMELTIEGETMTINWVSDSGDTKSLYWAGSYTAPTEPGDSWEWESANDHEQTDYALLASTDDTKSFSYHDGVISWETSALGTTKTMKAERVE